MTIFEKAWNQTGTILIREPRHMMGWNSLTIRRHLAPHEKLLTWLETKSGDVGATNLSRNISDSRQFIAPYSL